mmetsp:Transcript_5085/g.7775  ORF Transcript_5085/g.7775 Transcript_5085/m.7775 type:complete len:129 (-) Transcript_5085:88-474(-)
MIELRQRLRGYELVNTEEDIDSTPDFSGPPVSSKEFVTSRPQSQTCYWILVYFSLSGVVFLSVIAYLLKSNSLYIKVAPENESRKKQLGDGVIGAIVMYIVTAALVLVHMYRSSKEHYRVQSSSERTA